MPLPWKPSRNGSEPRSLATSEESGDWALRTTAIVAHRTLETGCEFDFPFVDETTAEVGLNEYVYTLKKQ